MNTYVVYYDLYQFGQVIQAIAAAFGRTPLQLLEDEFDLFSLLESVESPAPGELHGVFKAGITMDVSYNPATLTVTHVRTYFNGQLGEEWSGAMTAQEFLSEDWPYDVKYGTQRQDILDSDNLIYAGDGNDILQLEGNATAYGQGGVDVYDLSISNGAHITLADYQPGEKILFDYYDSWQSLVNAFQGVSDVTAHGFTLNFGGSYSPQWSLTIEGTALEQMRIEDLLVGDAAAAQIYEPLFTAFGIV